MTELALRRSLDYLFHQMLVKDCRVTWLNDLPEVYALGRIERFSHQQKKEVEASLLCVLFGEDQVGDNLAFFDDLLGEGGNIVSLGSGYICQFCRSYLSAGVSRCWNCGGIVNREPLASVSHFPFILREYTITHNSGDFTTVECDFIATGEVHFNPEGGIEGLFGTDLDFLPSGYSLQEEYFICECCLSTVPVGDKYPRCGGERIPLSEVVKMDHECAYCGRKVTGGVVCDSCGATLHAVAYRTLRGQP